MTALATPQPVVWEGPTRLSHRGSPQTNPVRGCHTPLLPTRHDRGPAAGGMPCRYLRPGLTSSGSQARTVQAHRRVCVPKDLSPTDDSATTTSLLDGRSRAPPPHQLHGCTGCLPSTAAKNKISFQAPLGAIRELSHHLPNTALSEPTKPVGEESRAGERASSRAFERLQRPFSVSASYCLGFFNRKTKNRAICVSNFFLFVMLSGDGVRCGNPVSTHAVLLAIGICEGPLLRLCLTVTSAPSQPSPLTACAACSFARPHTTAAR